MKACGDCLVMLSAQLITNETSNLAECCMSIRSIFDGGKQYNRVQSRSFEGRCYAAGMRVQAGPTWQLETVEHILSEAPGKVLYLTKTFVVETSRTTAIIAPFAM